MMPALKNHEAQRLEALFNYDILDTAAEPCFDQVTDLAAQIAGTPIALISLVDDKRQWFKAKVGLDVCETDRSVAFCHHTIMQSEPFCVPDARAHPLFADNPLVWSEPNIRFYYGVPLTTPENYNIGSLCVIDRTPRLLNIRQRTCLGTLANLTVHMLEDRRVMGRNHRQQSCSVAN